MARQHGTPGRTLVQSILGLMLLPATVGLGAYLIFGAMSPALRFAAPLVGFFAVVMVLRSRSFERAFVAKARGAIGENAVGRALQRLPTGWRAFHDVRLDGENVDHVVVSNRGVFSIEVKNYSGKVKIGTAGIIAHGQRNDRIVLQAQRQAHRLRTLLGVDVQPLLVFVGRDVAVTAMGTLTVMGDSGLVPWLLRRTERALDLETGRRVFTTLESLVAGSARPNSEPKRAPDRPTMPMDVRTSLSHPLQVFWIPGLPTPGALGLTFTPGMRGPTAFGYAWARGLDADLERLRTVHRADVLVSLLERHEYGLLGVPDLPDLAAAGGLDVHHFPISDGSVPPPELDAAFGALAAGIRSELDAGKRVVVQSRRGIGRAGLVAAAVVTTFGGSSGAAIERVRRVQPGAVETREQGGFLADFADRQEPEGVPAA
jgi:protein-tyrosine phosphatase